MAEPLTELGDYRIEKALTPRRTFLAMGPGDRRVVLKILDEDCLLRGQLHPNVHARLSRVRELAHQGVANLLTVQREGNQAFAVWEFLPGEPLDRFAANLTSAGQFTELAREIVLAVQSLHELGLVHGRISAANVIVDELGRAKLTHVSPLLYDDPAVDQRDLANMLGRLARQRGWGDSDLVRALGQTTDLKELRARLSSHSGQAAEAPAEPALHRAFRSKALVGALIAAAVAAVAAIVVVRLASDRRAPIRPPEAPPQALER